MLVTLNYPDFAHQFLFISMVLLYPTTVFTLLWITLCQWLLYLHPFRDEMSTQYSPMSEESDDYRYYDTQVNTNGNQTDTTSSSSASPISSPHRVQRPYTWFSSPKLLPLPSCSLSAVVCSQARRGSGSEHEGRIPSSPTDMCHGGDLRRTALLRSVQMRVQSPHPCDLLSSSGHRQDQERGHVHADELDHDQRHTVGVHMDQRSFSCPKSIQDAEPSKVGPAPWCGFCRGSDYGVISPKINHDNISGELNRCGWPYT